MLKNIGRWPSKLLFLLAAAFSLLGLIDGAQAAESGSGAAFSKKLLVGFAQDNLANDWRLAQVQGIKRALERYPTIEFVYTDGRGSTAQQIQDVEDLLRREIDILITSPRDSSAMTPVINHAYQMGIPVILLTRRIEGDAYSTFIAPDDEAIARDAARFIAGKLHGKGRVLVLQGLPSTTTARIRTEAFIDELAKHPEMQIAAIKAGNYLRGDAIRAMEEVLQQGIDFDAIYAQSDSMASGARIALSKAGIEPSSVPTVGIDYIKEAQDAIRLGQQSASYTYPTCAEQAVEVILRLAEGKPVPKSIHVRSQRITRDNVGQIKPIF